MNKMNEIEYEYKDYYVNWEGKGIYYLHKGKLSWQVSWVRIGTYDEVAGKLREGKIVDYLSVYNIKKIVN